jgi:hypothetical protein
MENVTFLIKCLYFIEPPFSKNLSDSTLIIWHKLHDGEEQECELFYWYCYSILFDEIKCGNIKQTEVKHNIVIWFCCIICSGGPPFETIEVVQLKK